MTGLLVLAVFALLVVAVVRAGSSRSGGTMYCPTCGTVGTPQRRTRGSFWIEVVLWLCAVVPGLVYSIWRLTTRYDACPSCRAPGMIPAGSPRAIAELAGRPPPLLRG